MAQCYVYFLDFRKNGLCRKEAMETMRDRYNGYRFGGFFFCCEDGPGEDGE